MTLDQALSRLNTNTARQIYLNDALHVALRSNDDATILEARRALNDWSAEKANLNEYIDKAQRVANLQTKLPNANAASEIAVIEQRLLELRQYLVE